MKLKIFTLKGLAYEGEIESLNAKTKAGEITVLDHHRPLITILVRGEMRIVSEEREQKVFSVISGFLEVRPGNEVSVILN